MLKDRWERKATDDHVHSATILIVWQTESGLLISKNVLIKPRDMSGYACLLDILERHFNTRHSSVSLRGHTHHTDPVCVQFLRYKKCLHNIELWLLRVHEISGRLKSRAVQMDVSGCAGMGSHVVSEASRLNPVWVLQELHVPEDSATFILLPSHLSTLFTPMILYQSIDPFRPLL